MIQIHVCYFWQEKGMEILEFMNIMMVNFEKHSMNIHQMLVEMDMVFTQKDA